MAIHLNPWDKYRGPGGPDSDKTRDQRKQELLEMMNIQDGCEAILSLWQESEGIPGGESAPDGTSVRANMISAILKHEYPDFKAAHD
jgi:hypothetical protein